METFTGIDERKKCSSTGMFWRKEGMEKCLGLQERKTERSLSGIHFEKKKVIWHYTRPWRFPMLSVRGALRWKLRWLCPYSYS